MVTFEELKKQQGVTVTKKPKKKGLLRKAGEFIAPTTTGLLTGEKPITGRALLGAALEVGSLAIPSTAVLRGVGVAGRVIRGAKAVSTATKVARGAKIVKAVKAVKTTEGLTFESLKKGTGELGRKLKSQAKTGAKVGAITGGAFGAGRALGDEDLSLKEVAGEAAIGAAFGAVGGAVLTPAVSFATLSAKGTARAMSNAWKSARAKLNPADRASAVDDIAMATLESFEDKVSTLKKLQTISEKGKRITKDPNFDELAAIKEVVDEGYIPKVRGGLLGKGSADYTGAIADVKKRRSSLGKGVDIVTKGIKETTKSSDLRKQAKATLVGRTDIEPGKVGAKVDAIITALEKEVKTKNFTAEHVNLIKKRTGVSTGAFKKEQFIQDAENAVRSVSRTRLDVLDPDITRLNADSTKLARVIETMQALQNQTIDVGFFSTGAGRFIGTLGGAAIGISIAGPGGLVVAGILAQIGSRGLATIIRQARFNVARQAIIRQGLRSDAKLLQEILKKAAPEDATVIRNFMGQTAIRKVTPPKKQKARISKSKSIPKIVPPKKEKSKSVFGAKLPPVVKGRETARSKKGFEDLSRLTKKEESKSVFGKKKK